MSDVHGPKQHLDGNEGQRLSDASLSLVHDESCPVVVDFTTVEAVGGRTVAP